MKILKNSKNIDFLKVVCFFLPKNNSIFQTNHFNESCPLSVKLPKMDHKDKTNEKYTVLTSFKHNIHTFITIVVLHDNRKHSGALVRDPDKRLYLN